MANIKSAIKRARQNTKLRAHNSAQRSMLRTMIKNVIKAIESGSAEAANTAFTKAQSVIDKSVKKGLIHKNKAARHKSRLLKRIRALAA